MPLTELGELVQVELKSPLKVGWLEEINSFCAFLERRLPSCYIYIDIVQVCSSMQ